MEREEAASMLVDGELRAAAAGYAKNTRERLDFSQPHALEPPPEKKHFPNVLYY
jgi:hypothetical protein